MAKIKYAGEAIDALGGTMAVSRLFGTDARVVSNWRARGFPPDTYAVMAPILSAQGHEFSTTLFGQRQMAAQARPAKPRRGRPAKNLQHQAAV